MMSSDLKITLSRRRLLGFSAGMAALSLLPMSALARPLPVFADSGLQVWIKRMGSLDFSASAGEPQRWVFRPVYIESTQPPVPLSVAMVYRSCPDQPFELFRGCASPGQGGVSVQASTDALEGLALRRLDRPQAAVEPCPFDHWLQPSLSAGHYAVLVNSGPRRWRADWSLVDWDESGGVAPAPESASAWKHWQLLSLDVSPA